MTNRIRTNHFLNFLTKKQKTFFQYPRFCMTDILFVRRQLKKSVFQILSRTFYKHIQTTAYFPPFEAKKLRSLAA